MKSFAFAALIGAASAVTSIELDYINYMAKFNKQHDDVDMFNARLSNFKFVDQFIKEHNATSSSHRAGHNQFSDWSEAEYKSILGYVPNRQVSKRIVKLNESSNADTVNWVTAGAVTPVKDQGQCGSCWAFSTTGSLEGAHFVASGSLLSFSEQQLVDCAYIKYGNYGCNGGLQTNAYMYYEDGFNAELESVYPYTSGAGQRGTCQYSKTSQTAVAVSGYTNVTPDNVAQMKAAVTQQPLAVAIEADKLVFQTYSSGVLNSTKCGTTLDHAVLAVGYGNDAASGLDYWLIKNSWNTTWGDQGYVKLAITGDDAGTCGVQSDPQWVKSN